MNIDRVLSEIRVRPGKPAGLRDRPTDWRDEPELKRLTSDELEDRVRHGRAAGIMRRPPRRRQLPADRPPGA